MLKKRFITPAPFWQRDSFGNSSAKNKSADESRHLSLPQVVKPPATHGNA
jgi:hypothetical protein